MMSVVVKTVDGPYKTISIEREDETELSMYCTIQDGIVDVGVVLLSSRGLVQKNFPYEFNNNSKILWVGWGLVLSHRIGACPKLLLRTPKLLLHTPKLLLHIPKLLRLIAKSAWEGFFE
eukprot:2823101-Amphidinium_carterae.1